MRGDEFVCRECGYQTVKWLGRCPSCGSFDSFERIEREKSLSKVGKEIKLTPVSSADIQPAVRVKTGIEEFDRVLGGGFVPGSAVLLSGEPGIGKSTLLLQVAASLSKERPVVYITGEESFEQVVLRAKRLNIDSENLYVIAEQEIDSVLSQAQQVKPVLVIADSVQTLYVSTIGSSPGSVTQVREVAQELIRFAKKSGTPVIMIGHVTKEGAIAGPKLLEHIVDTVIYFEGDAGSYLRVLRTTKNRFGATDELGVFEMHDTGLHPVKNPSAAFLSSVMPEQAVIYPVLEGTRVLLTEVQSIVSPTVFVNPRRTSSGIDPVRMAIIIAILENRASVSFAGTDIYLTTSAGIRVKETAADLPVAISLYRALTLKTNGPIACFGELGLDGSVRPVFQPEQRIKEALRFGIKRIIIPAYDRIDFNDSSIEVVQARTLNEALEAVR